MGLYTTLESLDRERIFFYAGIIIFAIFFFRDKTIGLNVILALVLAVVVISYFYEKSEVSTEIEEKQQEVKLDAIHPPTKNFGDKDDIIDFFFSVQDFYHYNPQTYEDTVDLVDIFLKIHKIVYIGTVYCDDYYKIAETKKAAALNSFHAIIHSLPDDHLIVEKFDRAHKRLETILTKYLNEIYNQCKNSLVTKGYNIHRRAINLGPKEYNNFTDASKDYTFDFY